MQRITSSRSFYYREDRGVLVIEMSPLWTVLWSRSTSSVAQYCRLTWERHYTPPLLPWHGETRRKGFGCWRQVGLFVVCLGLPSYKMFYELIVRSLNSSGSFHPFWILFGFLCTVHLHYTIGLILESCLFLSIIHCDFWPYFMSEIYYSMVMTK